MEGWADQTIDEYRRMFDTGGMRIFSVLAISLIGMCVPSWSRADEKLTKEMESAPQLVDTVELISVLQPTKGNTAAGVVRFKTLPDGKIEVSGEVRGLQSNSEHGFHIHQYGDLTSEDGSSLGDHYDPLHMQHALPHTEQRHAGDFGNIKANADGVADIKIVVDNISLSGQKNPILGRGLVVHAKPDDGGQPSGNAGARIAVGVIGVSNPKDTK